jgi:asparagine synthase (glutamine-hydrolysing)
LAALLDLKSEKSAPDLQKSYDYLVFGKYDHHNNTFFKDIKHLPPGYLVQYDVINKNLSNPKRWWAPQPSEQINISYNDAIYQVRNQFLDNLKLHLRSDVNIGASLSGGLDSSAIVCGMRYLEPELPIHTFSYIPSDQLINEEKWIDLVNLHTKAHANKIYFSENDFNQDLDDLIKLQGEPFGSTSIYAQYQVFKKIKQKNIVVTLEGQGADELLGGYQGYPNYLIKSLIENKQIFQSILFANNWSKTNNKRKFSAGLYYTNAILPEKIASAFLGYLKINASHDCLNINYFKDHDINFLQTTRSFSDTNKGRRLVEKLLSALTSDG